MSTDRSASRASRATTVVRVAAIVALLAVSASLSIPIGPVPITLQMLVLFAAALIVSPKEFLAGVSGYLLIGALGLPVFSGFKGGVGVLFGPTGGFLIGFLVAAILVRVVFHGGERASLMGDVVKLLIVLAGSYLFGWIQLQIVTGMDPVAAFVAGIAPFFLIDLAKAGFAFLVARSVKMALGIRTENESCS